MKILAIEHVDIRLGYHCHAPAAACPISAMASKVARQLRMSVTPCSELVSLQ